MAQTTDASNFFQTTASIASLNRKALKAKKTKNVGEPIQLPSKILAVIPAPPKENGDTDTDADLDLVVYVAESAGTARRVGLFTKDISHIYRGPQAPLTSLAFSPSSSTSTSTPAHDDAPNNTPKTSTLFAGCWDKSIWSWNTHTRRPGRRYFGHGDFVKSVACVRVASGAESSTDLLISGAQDACIIVWDAATGARLHTLTGHARGVLDLAVDPLSLLLPAHANVNANAPREITLFSAGSDRQIRRWRVSVRDACEATRDSSTTTTAAAAAADADDTQILSPITHHETSVNALCMPGPRYPLADSNESSLYSSDENEHDNDNYPPLLTASSDHTAQILPRGTSFQRAAHTLHHPDYVRCIASNAPSASSDTDYIATGCRDEHVRLWDAATGALLCTFVGHWEEVSGVVFVGTQAQWLVSVGIDKSVRRWGVSGADVDACREREDGSEEEDEEEGQEEGVVQVQMQGDWDEVKGGRGGGGGKVGLLTDEEERELAEMMMDED